MKEEKIVISELKPLDVFHFAGSTKKYCVGRIEEIKGGTAIRTQHGDIFKCYSNEVVFKIKKEN